MTRPANADEAITVDEVGIRIGRYGDLHLKSAYQPVYRHRDGVLVPDAVEALIRPFMAGSPVSPLDFFAGVDPCDRLFVESLCRALHLKNHQNIGVPGIELFFNYDPRVNGDRAQSMAQLNVMAERLAASDLDIRLLVCEMTESDFLDRDTFVRLAAEIRRLGMRLAIDDFGAGHSTLERVQIVEPDFIKLDGTFFRRVASAPSALKLLTNLVRGLQRGGAQVLVEGIETADQLAAAIDCGADWVQGYLLGRPQLAGAMFDATPRSVERYTGQRDNIVRLYAGAHI